MRDCSGHTGDSGRPVEAAERYGRIVRQGAFAVCGENDALGLKAGVAALPETPAKHPEDLLKEALRRLGLAREASS